MSTNFELLITPTTLENVGQAFLSDKVPADSDSQVLYDAILEGRKDTAPVILPSYEVFRRAELCGARSPIRRWLLWDTMNSIWRANNRVFIPMPEFKIFTVQQQGNLTAVSSGILLLLSSVDVVCVPESLLWYSTDTYQQESYVHACRTRHRVLWYMHTHGLLP